jgi:hypothetical protein
VVVVVVVVVLSHVDDDDGPPPTLSRVCVCIHTSTTHAMVYRSDPVRSFTEPTWVVCVLLLLCEAVVVVVVVDWIPSIAHHHGSTGLEFFAMDTTTACRVVRRVPNL